METQKTWKNMSEEWKKGVTAILSEHGSKRANGKIASERTQTLTKEVIYAAFRQLHELGYRLQNPQNLKDKHIGILVKHWWYEKKKRPKTIQNELSRLRRFCEMMHKPGMVRNMRDYLPEEDPGKLVVVTAAMKDKSWDAAGLDMIEILNKTDQYDTRLGLMLRLELALGLRREEVLKCDVHTQDYRDYFAILPGQGKGGRTRTIPMNEASRKVLDYVKSRVKKGEVLGWPYTKNGEKASLKQNLDRYRNSMCSLGFTKKDLGITGHGLRAQFAENNALIHGLLPPTLGGSKNQYEKTEQDTRLKQLSEAMGHHRTRVMPAYYGSFKKKEGTDMLSKRRKNIEEGIRFLPSQLNDIPEERRNDCISIRNSLDASFIDLSLKQIHALWQLWSGRCGSDWVKPSQEAELIIEAISVGLIKKSAT